MIDAAFMAAVLLFAFAFMLHVGRLSVLINDSARTLALGLELALFLAGAGTCVVMRSYAAPVFSVALAVYYVLEAMLFSRNFGTELNLNVLSGFFGILAPVLFVPALRILGPSRIVNILFAAVCIYAVIYLLLSIGAPGFSPKSAPNADQITIGADASAGRPERFYILSGPIAFAIFVSLTRIISRRAWWYVLPLGLCLADVWLSYFRVIGISIAAVIILFMVLRNTKLVGLICLGGFLAVTAVLLIGLLIPHFYPFDIFGGRDASASVRGLSYEVIRRFSLSYWLFGVGYASSGAATIYLVSSDLFFASDLGSAGVFYESGIVGSLLLIWLSIIAATSRGRLDTIGFNRADADALALTGAVCVLFGVLVPDLWNGSSTIFAGFFVAVWLIAQSSKTAVAVRGPARGLHRPLRWAGLRPDRERPEVRES